ncbi:MAG: aminotransferase class III-fold pyridoxal phosphate-dependent enzyme [Gemmatimonadetes bacterium]|nr:aminotransferase class III-fold pyridoxal phosphate-dependent enzyme [Gemmatimonadota bacterium]
MNRTLSFEVPEVALETVRAGVAKAFGLTGEFSALPGERDRNYRLDATDGGRYVVKVANRLEDPGVLDLQNAALIRIADHEPGLALPTVVPSLEGRSLVTLEAEGGPYLMRVLTWVTGAPLAEVRPRTREQLRGLGELLARMHRGLEGFDHPSARRALKWDLGGAHWIAGHFGLLDQTNRRGLAERLYRPFKEQVLPHWDTLPSRVIFGDANDHNVLIDGRSVGLIDFGDMVWSATVADVAIAAAYGMLDIDDPLAGAAALVEGYTAVRPLTDRELDALYPSILARLVVSVVNSALQRATTPDHDYLFVSEAPIWRLLDRLGATHPRLATYRLRAAAGREPCPGSHRVSRWITDHEAGFIPIIGTDPGILPPRVDLSIGSEFLDDFRLIDDDAALERRINWLRQSVGARVAIGEYDEARLLYTSELFRTEGFDGPEWRTVHIGLDLFAEAGCPVRTPIAGRVKSVRHNAGPRDYGPTVVVEHHVTDHEGLPLTFYTLYGHLDLETLASLHPGQPLQAGATVGRLGAASINGGWPPHVHFQVVVDLLDRSGEFPGVARPSEREVWTSLSPAPHRLAGVPNTRTKPLLDGVAILDRRARVLGGNLSVSYRRPLHIVRGWMQHLYDTEGRRYLDAVNNVPHVGHSHPRVVRAGQRQMAVLNTNTRYLHETVVRYAERLGQLLPDPLRVCFFVNSGTEANELALRLASTHTGRRGTIVVDSAYHGNTATLVGLSPYKCEGAGGHGLAPFARKVALPDRYRGRFRGEDPGLGERYAALVEAEIADLERSGHPIAAFMAESILSCGGQIVLPPGYLAGVYRRVRRAGGVAIADEVQVGFGRVGSHFWGFETQNVVPDIVVMGKPAGNGHPLGIVVTTPEIARSFANGMEFFSTFGGNPVSAAIGLAVLDVIFDEDLQARALATGHRLLTGLKGLVDRHPAAGDARGLGLFVGLELVTDRETRTPDPEAATYLSNRMRDRGFLISTDGPDHNVLKIKPPLCFSAEDADALVDGLDQVLGEDAIASRSRSM